MTKSLNFFIVEDEKIVRKDIEYRLIKMDHKVVGGVASGEEALQMFEEINPDIIIMDIRLSGDIDGIETARRIREKSDIPIIFASQLSSHEVIDKASSTLPEYYLIKPFEDCELYAAIEIASNKIKSYSRFVPEAIENIRKKEKELEATPIDEIVNYPSIICAFQTEEEYNEFSSIIYTMNNVEIENIHFTETRIFVLLKVYPTTVSRLG